MITFHNATCEDGRIVHIDKVTKENRAEHYYCIGCGGEMSAVLGEKREHHFRHKETHCSWETYLHKLGKKLLKERFETQREFIVEYCVEYHCDKTNNCKFEPFFKNRKCNRRELKSTDLKRIYDICEEEVTYKGFRADLMLSNSKHPELAPVFLEISVTHDCNPEKLASGIPIIELKITDEKDVLRPLIEDNKMIDATHQMYLHSHNILPPTRFYNFKRMFETSHPIDRFWINQDENGILRGHCEQAVLNCRNIDNNHKENSLYEITVPTKILIRSRKLNLYEFGMMKAIDKGIGVKHCNICSLYNSCIILIKQEVEDERTGGKRLVTKHVRMNKISQLNFDRFALAASCRNYQLHRQYVYKVIYDLRKLTFQEWKRE